MVGISYPGHQRRLFVAPTQPPHLAAIAPLSVIADTYRSLAVSRAASPNVGFPPRWAQDRDERGASPTAQGWEQGIVDAGGAERGSSAPRTSCCGTRTPTSSPRSTTHPFREPVARPTRSRRSLLAHEDQRARVHRRRVAGRADRRAVVADLAEPHRRPAGEAQAVRHERHARRQPRRRARPLVRVPRLLRRAPRPARVRRRPRARADRSSSTRPASPACSSRRIASTATQSYASQLAAYEAEPPVRILFENGAGDPTQPRRARSATYEMSFPSWPPPQRGTDDVVLRSPTRSSRTTRADDRRRRRQGVDVVRVRPDRETRDRLPRQSVERHLGRAPRPTTGARCRSARRSRSTARRSTQTTCRWPAPGSVDLWLRSTAPDTDVEVTLTELRPDGQECYVQNGWLRASAPRKLDPIVDRARSPWHTDTSADAGAAARRPVRLGPRRAVPVRAHLPRRLPHAHHRRGAGRQPSVLDVRRPARERHRRSTTSRTRSATRRKVVLPVIPTRAAASRPRLPPCGSLRGEPCRTIVSDGAPTDVHGDAATAPTRP